jgi:hypothetical protein
MTARSPTTLDQRPGQCRRRDVDGEPRYTLNGVIQTGAPPSDVRDALLVNMAGTYTYSNGSI